MVELGLALLAGVAGGVAVAAVLVALLPRILRRAGAELTEAAGAAVRRGVEEGAAEALPQVREEVRRGAVDAADEVLPRLREEMRTGLESAVDEVVGERLGRAGRSALKTGSSVVEAGLDLLLGRDDRDGDR